MKNTASYYSKTDKGLRCELCPHECIIAEGKSGICRTRMNHGGELYALTYGKPCAVHVDPIEKKPLYHFLAGSKTFSIGTAGCNLHCLNCQNCDISQVSPADISHYDLPPSAVVEQALQHHCLSIAFTYNEPTVFYEYMLDTAALAREKGLKNVLVSNGYINEAPLRELCQLLDAANIDLKCFSDDIYHKLSGAHLQPVLDTLKIMKEKGVWLEITKLLIPGWTDDAGMIRNMCQWLSENGFADVPLHFSRFFPRHRLAGLNATPLETMVQAKEIALQSGIKLVYLGNV